MAARVLVIDDDPALLELMVMTLGKEGFEVCASRSVGEARQLLAERVFDLVVSDVYLGDGTGMDLFDLIRSASPQAAVILVTAQGTMETAAQAATAGVFDYLAKPFQLEQLVERVRAAVEERPAQATSVEMGPESVIIGNHPRIVEVYKAVARVAPLRVPVLVRGETGTGKELVARALHDFGPRPGGAFVAINCGAIPEGLLESELFGHRRGAFTGAVRDHRGAIESASGGTVFLDEVGELPQILQVKLLRFLQQGEIRPVGAEADVSVDVRVVAATHRDLRAAVDVGELREDFFYRLAAYEIEIPPLRERASDIPLLVEHFRRALGERMVGREISGPGEAAVEVLRHHSWPGNVRELENLVQRAAIDLGGMNDAEGLARILGAAPGGQPAASPAVAIGDDLTLEELERAHIEAVLGRCGGNRTRTAKVLGIERKTLYRKVRRLGITLDEVEGG